MTKQPLKREAGQSVEEMTEQLLASRQQNRMYKPSYPEASAAVKSEALAAAIDHQMEILAETRKRGRIDLNDLEQVEATAQRYMEACKAARIFPTFLGFSAAAGYGRNAIYNFIQAHPESQTVKYLDALRSAWAAILANAGLNRQFSEAVSIFLLKNSGQGLSDKQEIDLIARPQDPIGTPTDIKTLEERYLDLVDLDPSNSEQ